MNKLFSAVSAVSLLLTATTVHAADITVKSAIQQDYNNHLKSLFEHFHANPELSMQEVNTSKRMAEEFRQAGFEVTTGIGGTGVVAILKNGEGPMIAMRGDMDGLPIEEKSGLAYASTATQADSFAGGAIVPVMHACGHDVHITSLVGTARQMAAMRDKWSGTLMLIAQPGEERVVGAKAMLKDGIWEKFGTPDAVMAFHVSSGYEAGTINIINGSPNAGVDTVDIIVHGVGAHGASPHAGKDPIVIGSQIVMALQTVVSRELPPRTAGVITVGSFHAGTKHNIISDRAHLQLTVRNESLEGREILLNGIKRIAENVGRTAGLPDDMLPEVIISDQNSPPMVNDDDLANSLRTAWQQTLGEENVKAIQPKDMVAEDFPYFSLDPKIPSIMWAVGGTPAARFEEARNGGPAVPSHHSPIFKIYPEPAVTTGVESTVQALLHLMKK